MDNNIIHPMFSLNPSSLSLKPNTTNDNNIEHDLYGFMSGFKREMIDLHFPTPQAANNDIAHDCTQSSQKSSTSIKLKKARKTRFAFQTRSQVDILDDGYRWRKYGQKKVKNNNFPRSYYRCTYQGCNVKKQVQRLSGDESIVVTTYEGIHTHSVDKPTDNFEQILNRMQIYPLSN